MISISFENIKLGMKIQARYKFTCTVIPLPSSVEGIVTGFIIQTGKSNLVLLDNQMVGYSYLSRDFYLISHHKISKILYT